MIPVPDQVWKKVTIPVFAPYVLAGIGRKSLSDTALDRSLVVEMRRKPIGIRKEPYNYHRCDAECEPVRACLYLWALENATRVAEVYESRSLSDEIQAWQLNDRAADIWKPLLAVAKAIGDGAACDQLRSLASQTGRDADAEDRERSLAVVRVLRSKLDGTQTVFAMTSELLECVKASGIEMSEKELHDFLSSTGFAQTSARLEAGPRRAWELSSSKLSMLELQLADVIV
jgi:hypothetical protein